MSKENPIYLYLLFFGLLLLSSNHLNTQELSTIHVQSHQGTISVLEHAQYRFSSAKPPTNKADFNTFFDAKGWKPTMYSHQSFGTGKETLWLRFQITQDPQDNDVNNKQIYELVQQYAWIDHLALYYIHSNGRVSIQKSGDMIPYAKRNPPYRLPEFRFTLKPGVNQVLLRIESGSEKIIGLKLIEPNSTGDYVDYLSLLPIFFLSAISIAMFICLLIVIALREIFALYYFFYLSSGTAALLIWEGYGHQYLYPLHPNLNDTVAVASASVFFYFISRFWKHLLLMPLQFPLMNRIFDIFSWITLGFVLLVFIWPEYQTIWEIGSGFNMIVLIILFFWSSIYAIRLKFTPANLSIIGMIVFVLGIPVFGFSGIWPFPGNDFTRNAIYAFFLIEILFFLGSVVTRIQFLSNIAQKTGYGLNMQLKRSLHKQIQSSHKKPKSRLDGTDIRALSAKLNNLLQEEKLFADEDLNLERLAGLMELTRHQLSELIKITYRENYHQAMNSLRIQEACQLLQTQPERNILSIAMAVGYSSKSTFNTEFRKKMDESPSQYRKNLFSLKNQEIDVEGSFGSNRST